MSTWTSRVAALLLAVTLGGCDETTGLPFAAGSGPARERLAQVSLAGGQVVMAAPEGYCFDRASLRRGSGGFAMMARCDTLGVEGFFGTRPLAIVTVTTTPQEQGAPLPSPAAIAASAGGKLVDSAKSGRLVLAQLSGGGTLEGVSATHWRGVYSVGKHLVGVSLYAPEGSRALGREGARLLSALAAGSQGAAAAQ